jgi:hypothetical protein
MTNKKQRLTAKSAKKSPAVKSPDARQRLTEYLLSVIENPKANPRRRDEMAHCLARIEAYSRPGVVKPPKVQKATKAPPAVRVSPQPRVSTYVSKKREAEAESKTAYKGSSWDGLVNGSARAPAITVGDDE